MINVIYEIYGINFLLMKTKLEDANFAKIIITTLPANLLGIFLMHHFHLIY
jgi:hypothetical protein